MAKHAVKEYIIEITDDVLKSLGMTAKEAKKHMLTRCKDCRYFQDFACRLTQYATSSEYYCSYAKRKEE